MFSEISGLNLLRGWWRDSVEMRVNAQAVIALETASQKARISTEPHPGASIPIPVGAGIANGKTGGINHN